MTRVSTSRPRWSVPNQCAALGGWNLSIGLPFSGFRSVNSPGAAAQAAVRISTAAEIRTGQDAVRALIRTCPAGW